MFHDSTYRSPRNKQTTNKQTNKQQNKQQTNNKLGSGPNNHIYKMKDKAVVIVSLTPSSASTPVAGDRCRHRIHNHATTVVLHPKTTPPSLCPHLPSRPPLILLTSPSQIPRRSRTGVASTAFVRHPLPPIFAAFWTYQGRRHRRRLPRTHPPHRARPPQLPPCRRGGRC